MFFVKKIYKKIIPKGNLRPPTKNDEMGSNNLFGPDISIELIGGGKPNISIGLGTYCNGMKIYCWDDRVNINIGKYCSLADNIIITAGGEHEKEWVSSYPFVKKYKREDLYYKQKIRYKGDISIGNDVWIANNVSILSGVKIGDGAVIGAGSMVVKDVEPYGIAVGNPARVYKKRFDSEDIESLLMIKWWEWPLEKILKNLHLFDDVKSFIKENISQK